jgi:uncharacterized protein
MSPRKKKQRNCVCPLREKLGFVFKPAGTPLGDLEVVVLEHDELEALYLCDGLDFNQELAGEKMGVSRGTVQRLLSQGRKKLIEALVGQKALAMSGKLPGVVPDD